MFYLQDGVIFILLWRGTMRIPIPFRDEPLLFPIHSVTAFLCTTFLVEHPQWIPSFFFASIAWLMLASQEYRRSLPEVWSRCKSFKEFVQTLATGESPEPPESIEANENYEKAQVFLDKWKKRIEDAEAAAAKSYEEQIRAQEEYEREMEELGDTEDTDIATKSGGGVSVDPFKGLLYPVQQNLALVCRYGRSSAPTGSHSFVPPSSHLTPFLLLCLWYSATRETCAFLAGVLHCILDHGWLHLALHHLLFHSLVLLHSLVCQNHCVEPLWPVDETCRRVLCKQDQAFDGGRAGTATGTGTPEASSGDDDGCCRSTCQTRGAGQNEIHEEVHVWKVHYSRPGSQGGSLPRFAPPRVHCGAFPTRTRSSVRTCHVRCRIQEDSRSWSASCRRHDPKGRITQLYGGPDWSTDRSPSFGG